MDLAFGNHRATTTDATGAPDRIVAAGSDRTLVEQIVHHYAARIDERLMRSGLRMPSIRRFAIDHRVSRFTVVGAPIG